MSDNMTLEEFANKSLDLLRLEEEAEVFENSSSYEKYSLKELKSRGFCLLKLQIQESNSGMYGRQMVTFQHQKDETELPEHNLKSGDLVGIGEFGDSLLWQNKMGGIVTNIKKSSITVVVNTDSVVEIEKTYHVFRVSNGSTYKRMRFAMKKLLKGKLSNSRNMVNVLFGMAKPSSINSSTLKFEFVNPNLNEEQKEAVSLCLCQKEIAVIHGPPGTGKTTTLVETIVQMIKQGLKILACAPSNVAADNLVECLSRYTKKIVRLGHPARSMPKCHQFNIDYLMSQTDNCELVRDVEKEINQVNKRLRANSYGFSKFSLRNEKNKLFSEKRLRQNMMLGEVLQEAEVVVSTLTSASCDGHLSCLLNDHFDVVVIDECSQAMEAACWIPLWNVKKCILAGDHNQLPPVILSDKAEKEGLGMTLMERVLNLHGEEIKKLLTIQYRMHKDIMEWPSQQLYQGLLTAHESNANYLLCDLPNVEKTENTSIPLVLIDTAGCDMNDMELVEDDSKGNEGEADLVCIYVESLIKSGLDASDIGVITPYNLQVEIIRARTSMKYPTLEVHSVDSFQGREKEAIILSFVRSNVRGGVGFLRNHCRINVAITRAKRHLAVICDSDTVSKHPFLKLFIEYLQEKGEVRSASQYDDEISALPPNEWLEAKRISINVQDCQRKSKSNEDVEKPKHASSTEKGKRNSKSHNVDKPTTKNEKEEKLRTEVWQHKCSKMLKESFIKPIEIFLREPFSVLEFSVELDSNQNKVLAEIGRELGLLCRSEARGSTTCMILAKANKDNNGDHMVLDIFGKWSVVKPQTDLKNDGMSVLTSTSQGNLVDNHESTSANNESALREQVNAVEPTSKDQVIDNELALGACASSETSYQNILKDSNIKLQHPQRKDSETAKKKKSTHRPLTATKETLKPMPLNKVETEDDFDKLIAAAIQQDNMCLFRKCKNNTSVLLLQCMHCKHRFCTEHIQYEVHGCGEAAKIHERAQFKKLGRAYPGSGKPERVQSVYRKTQLNLSIDKKLKDLAGMRKRKDTKK